MSKHDPSAHPAALIRRFGPNEAGRVEPVKVEVRTGERFIITDPLRGVRGQPPQYVVRSRLAERNLYVGGIVVEWGFDVLSGFEVAFHRWLLDNEADLYTARPDDGVRYSGTYAVHSTTDRASGAYRTMWAFDSFQDFDDLGGALADDYPSTDPSTAFGELVREYFAFWDRGPHAGSSQQTLVVAAGSSATARFAGHQPAPSPGGD